MPPSLATITVTFNPDQAELLAQLHALPASCIKVLVDNGSHLENLADIESIINRFENLHLIRCNTNLGLAAAINRGAQWLAALASPPDFLLLLDQDSEPLSGSIATLLAAFQNLLTQGKHVGCVGPLMADPDTGLTHGFHLGTRLRWTRIYPPRDSTTPIPCSNLNGSGTLMPFTLFQQLGGLDEGLFIDHVDTEWSFRVIAHGYELWGVPNAMFKHGMGQASMRFWLLGWRVWPVRSPLRHYYLYRNAIILMHRAYVPLVWKTWAVAKLMLTTGIVAIIGPGRREQIKNMWQGAKDGLTKNES